MTQEEKIKTLLDICNPCIIVSPTFTYDARGNRRQDALMVVGETHKRTGHSWGVGTRYDYGFMQLDVESGITVIIL